MVAIRLDINMIKYKSSRMLSEDNGITTLSSIGMDGIGVIYHNIIINVSHNVHVITGNVVFRFGDLIIKIAIQYRLLNLLLLVLYLLL